MKHKGIGDGQLLPSTIAASLSPVGRALPALRRRPHHIMASGLLWRWEPGRSCADARAVSAESEGSAFWRTGSVWATRSPKMK